MRKCAIKILLSALNSRLFNQSPCEYGFIGNVDAFSYQNLASEEKQRPGITIKTILEEADHFRSCPLRKDGGLTVMDENGSHAATIWDVHQLQRDFSGDPKA